MNVLVVDDELYARQELAYLVQEHPQVSEVRMAESVTDALMVLLDFEVDVLFLDIQLKGETGFDLAEKLQAKDYLPYLIFATAYDDYALKAFQVDASDYVLKPFDQADIHRALDKAYRSQATPSTEGPSLTDTGLLAVPGDERVYMISPDDIVLLTVDGHQLRMETVQRTYEFSDSLAAWEQKLPEGTFMKTHRSFLINLQKVREVQPYFNQTYQVTMANGSKVPVSRTYTKLFKQRLNIE
ncbi:DNA-binding response regulator [Suicoccus acidiformans]|uniref:DNA-binding response regulator n=1 Tax=Suicoccus acidiformans TaxID=2036206 RepID=A0A347WI75_9LACT|nr:LytTR family transcriptional regulator DNA-binding domain-containing protein [Suicoccus acidiformans]AXY24782.1 DNA-binding response regulator [Suicoccus acidiformans]